MDRMSPRCSGRHHAGVDNTHSTSYGNSLIKRAASIVQRGDPGPTITRTSMSGEQFSRSNGRYEFINAESRFIPNRFNTSSQKVKFMETLVFGVGYLQRTKRLQRAYSVGGG